MKLFFTLCLISISTAAFSLDPNHFTINRITAPYFIVDGNTPTTLTKAYVGFEVKNNSNSATTYNNLKFTISSIGTSVVGQNYSVVSPATGIINVGTLAPGETKVCYFYVAYPANVTPQATFNVVLSDNTASSKTQAFVIRNRSSISANAGGAATQTFTNQDLIGGTVIDDVTYAVGNVQNTDESDFQVAVSTQFDPTKVTLLSTQVISSSVPGINVGTTDSLYFITGNGSNGATVTVRWTFRITGFNFTTYLLPCAGSTSGATNYKYALNTSLGTGSPVTVSAGANPLTITKTSDKSVYGVSAPAVFTITISNPGAYGVTIDKITDQIPAGFSYQSLNGTSQVTTANSTAVPTVGATGAITFEGGVTTAGNTSYYVPAGGNIVLKYNALSAAAPAANLVTNARDYVGITEVGVAQNTVGVSTTLPVSLLSYNAAWMNDYTKLNWVAISENNSQSIIIERNNNGSFIKIGELSAIIAADATTYSFIDSFPATGTNQYRLKFVDNNGTFKYSPVVYLHKKQKGLLIQHAYPAPFNDELNIPVSTDQQQKIQIRLINMVGTAVISRTENCQPGSSVVLLKGLRNIAPGTYFLQIISAEESVQQKLIKL